MHDGIMTVMMLLKKNTVPTPILQCILSFLEFTQTLVVINADFQP
jgi:hypothetical protein